MPALADHIFMNAQLLTCTAVLQHQHAHLPLALMANADKTKTLSGLFEHLIYDTISFVETVLFTIFGTHLILDENFNKFIFCSTVTGIHGLGLLVKCTYYQHMHPWMNLSSNQQRMNKFMNFTYACLGVTLISLLFYFGIHFEIIAFIVGGSLIISLVRVDILNIFI